MIVAVLSNEKVRYLDLLFDNSMCDAHHKVIGKLILKGSFWKSLSIGPATGQPGKTRVVGLLDEEAWETYKKAMRIR